MKSDKIEDIVLSILCRSVNMDATVNSIVGKLSQLPFDDIQEIADIL
ncbi:hypothetical protein MCHI_002723 [Candidatus Magnetoovum chiemensis]|nr:hypothetical protein MCHI_002723 [Candidatus Magnetoovum chiemensis]